MKIRRRIGAVIRKAEFDASFPYNIVMLFTNPFFFVRKNLYCNIAKYAKYFKGRLLDFGCGCKPYQNLFTGCSEYIGLDIANPGHSHKNENVDFYYDGKRIPFEDGSIDCIFSSEVLEHVRNIDTMIPELNRILCDGGMMMLTVPFVWNEHEMPNDYRRYTSNGIRYILKENGFRVLKAGKSTGYMEVIFQLWIEYIRSVSQKKNRTVKSVMHIVFCVPAVLAGIVLQRILPENDTLYGDNIIICKKVKK